VAEEAQTNLLITEPLLDGDSEVKTSLLISEPLTEGLAQVQTNLLISEPLTEGYSNVYTSLLVLESLISVPKEPYMSTNPFPGFGNSAADPSVPAGANPAGTSLPGLAFDVKKKPGFNTRISSAASGNEVRNALMEYPIWEFELTYEFLEDQSGAESSLKTILGFFLSRQGAFDSWLFKDPDDYLVVNGACGDTDGVTTQFSFKRTMGEFQEKIGQIDTVNTITLYLSIEEADTIPASPGPYTVTVVNAANFTEDLGVVKGGVPMTKVTAAPAAGEYSVDEGTGIYTFNATDESDAIDISYRYEIDPVDYTVTMPNLVVFGSAPAAGVLSADFQFYFVCRFVEDQLDFEKFADKLWNLNSCEFKSIIQ